MNVRRLPPEVSFCYTVLLKSAANRVFLDAGRQSVYDTEENIVSCGPIGICGGSGIGCRGPA